MPDETPTPKKKPTPPDFTLTEIGVELPAPEPKMRAGGGEKRAAFVQNLQAIQETPGVWFVVGRYTTRTGAKKVFDDVMSGKQSIPPGVYDADHRPALDDEGRRKHSEIIARYVGKTKEEVEAFYAEHGEYESAYNPVKEEEPKS